MKSSAKSAGFNMAIVSLWVVSKNGEEGTLNTVHILAENDKDENDKTYTFHAASEPAAALARP